MLSIFQRMGRAVLDALRGMGRMGTFFATSLYWTVKPPLKFGRVLRQISFIGSKSIPLIVLTGGFTGMILGLQVYYTLRKFGAEAYLGPAVALSLIRELGPVLSALMITGRAGSAIAAEIGIMRISEQVDALESMSLSPFRYLMTPNLIASLFSFPLLGAIFNVVGIYGGYIVGVRLLGLSSGTYFSGIQDFVEMGDVTDSLIKSACFGIIVFLVCCYQGYYTRHGAEGVSRATTTAVVMASTLILVWDYFLNSVMI
ncbi:MAG: ABC transporter permease [Nitrospirae bacterium]|nr:ABC transporter permease [Nitrospirota bacterium]MBI5695906.1 ABC transporter permease [Nitrospirota bacterium]